MDDYRIDAASKQEWAQRALKAESKIAELEDRYGYIEEVWNDLYSRHAKQSMSINSMRERFQKIRDTNTEQYLDVLEEFVTYMEKASMYRMPESKKESET